MSGIRAITALIALWYVESMTPATGAEPGSSEAFVEIAKQARDRGQLQESVSAFEAAATLAPHDTDVLLHLGLAYAQTQRVDAARQTLTRAIGLDPRRSDLHTALARSELWAGQHAAARRAADAAVGLHRDDVEARLMSAQIAIAQQDWRRAEADLQAATVLAPDNPEALTALTDLKLAEDRPLEALELLESLERGGTLAAPLRERRERLRRETWRWRYALNLSYSDFSTANRDEWREAFQQLDWRWSDDTELQTRLETSERFGLTDTFLALGVTREFSPRMRGYLQLGGTPHAAFRERRSIVAGTAIRFDRAPTFFRTTVATLDLRLNEYASGHVETYQPGVEQYFDEGRWWLSARGIFTNDEHGNWQNGWAVRADLAVNGRLSTFVGYSDAPETSENVTLDSRTPFGGLTLAISTACTANVSYAREDRPNVYVRSVWTAGASCKL